MWCKPGALTLAPRNAALRPLPEGEGTDTEGEERLGHPCAWRVGTTAPPGEQPAPASRVGVEVGLVRLARGVRLFDHFLRHRRRGFLVM